MQAFPSVYSLRTNYLIKSRTFPSYMINLCKRQKLVYGSALVDRFLKWQLIASYSVYQTQLLEDLVNNQQLVCVADKAPQLTTPV